MWFWYVDINSLTKSSDSQLWKGRESDFHTAHRITLTEYINLCMFKIIAPIQPLSILVRQHSQHTICNEVLMKGEYGCLPASLSVLQSAHVIGGRVGSTAASSSLLTHQPPKNCIFHCSSATNHKSPSSTSEWHWHNENPRIWSKSSGDWHKACLWWSVRDKRQVSHNRQESYRRFI